jgi:hypothetical protein
MALNFHNVDHLALGAALMVRESRRSREPAPRARRSLYANPRVVDIDPTAIDPKKNNNYG